jgi:chromosome partitioning protein
VHGPPAGGCVGDPGKIVCFGNLKGGVGKTTLAANFAAYAAQHLKAQILIVDLDYQQSLSNMMLSAAGLVDAEPRVQNLFLPDCSLATIERSKVHLDPAISRGWLVPSGYDLSQVESRLLIELLLPSYAPASRVDVRYRLANALLRPEVRDSYGLIIIDMPPRLTMGGVNALIAAHHLVVPTVMDKLSAEAISQFLNQARAIKEEMKLGVELTAVVGTLSRTQYTADWHNDVIGLIDDATRQWSDQRSYRIERTLPRREDIARLAGIELAYNLPGAKGEVLRKRFFDPIFAEILTRIGLTPPP